MNTGLKIKWRINDARMSFLLTMVRLRKALAQEFGKIFSFVFKQLESEELKNAKASKEA